MTLSHWLDQARLIKLQKRLQTYMRCSKHSEFEKMYCICRLFSPPKFDTRLKSQKNVIDHLIAAVPMPPRKGYEKVEERTRNGYSLLGRPK
jgi:hypothetical protein